ncbi:MAG: RNA polymerase sigma factor [Acutalibacteraceae bacterium]
MLIDFEAAERIALKYYKSVYHYCFVKLQDQHTAEDITQDVFLFFQQKSPELSEDKIGNWLISVASKKVMDEFKANRKRPKDEVYEDIPDLEAERLLSEVEYSVEITEDEISRARNKIFSLLSPEEAALLKAVYEEHRKYSEIAESENISENALRIRISRLKAKVKAMAEVAFLALLILLSKL